MPTTCSRLPEQRIQLPICFFWMMSSAVSTLQRRSGFCEIC